MNEKGSSVRPYLTETNTNFINFLRALSSQAVVIGHGVHLLNISDHHVIRTLPSLSVLVFFVLSGFVISYSLSLKGVQYGFARYMIDRFARIYSALVPALLLSAIWGALFFLFYGEFPFSMSWRYFASDVLMLVENPVLQQLQYRLPDTESWSFLGFFGGNKPLWSLSLEWWYYVFFGAIFFRKNTGRSKYFWIFISLPFALGYAILPGRPGWGLSWIWMSGVVVHWLLSSRILVPRNRVLLWVSALATLALLFTYTIWSIVPFIPFFFFTMREFNEVASPRLNRFLRLFTWPSNYSYSIYILHYPLVLIAVIIGSEHPIEALVIVWVMSNILAFAFYRIFESRYKQIASFLKRKYERRFEKDNVRYV